MPLRIGNNLSITGMVSSFNTDDSIGYFWILLANECGEFDLCAGRPKDQDLAGVAHGFENATQKLLALVNMTASQRIGLVMNMPCRHLGVQDDLFGARETEMEYAGLQVVDPNDRVEVIFRHVVSIHWRAGSAFECSLSRGRRRTFVPILCDHHISGLIQVKSGFRERSTELFRLRVVEFFRHEIAVWRVERMSKLFARRFLDSGRKRWLSVHQCVKIQGIQNQ
jgi:hypothetical protein